MSALNRRHACPTCLVMHAPPKAASILLAFLRAVAFGVVEVLAALSLDGLLSVGLWAIAAWNAIYLTFLVIGLATMATKVMTDPKAGA